MTDLQLLSAFSRFLGWICLVLMTFLPASVLACWIYFDVFGPGITDRLGLARTYTIPVQLMPQQIVLGIAVMMVPVGIMMLELAPPVRGLKRGTHLHLRKYARLANFCLVRDGRHHRAVFYRWPSEFRADAEQPSGAAFVGVKLINRATRGIVCRCCFRGHRARA